MAARRTLSPIVLSLAVLVTTASAQAQDFNFTSVPRLTLGITNVGVAGASCAAGLVTFGPTTPVSGGISAPVTGSFDTRCGGGSVDILGGNLTLTTESRTVAGTIDADSIVGQLLPAGHGIIAVASLNNSIPSGVGLNVFVEPNGRTFTQGDLTGSWRVKTMSGGQFPDTLTERAFGLVQIGASGAIVPGTGLTFSSSGVEVFIGGNLSITSDGQISGFVELSHGEVTDHIDVAALMAPDKKFVGGIGSSRDNRSSMFFLQRDPPASNFAQSQIAGTWTVFALQGDVNDSASGTWLTGTVTFDATGAITASRLVDAAGNLLPGVSLGGFDLDVHGFITGSVQFEDGSQLLADATMFDDRRQIIGVNTFFAPDETTSVGLFTMFKQGPPPPASTVQFSAATYRVTEGGTATITVTRGGATSTAITVDFTATDPVADSTLAAGTLSFEAGQTSKTFMVSIPQNFSADGDRTVDLQLSNPTNGATLSTTRSRAALLVIDDDSVFQFTESTYSVNENAGKKSITVTRTGGLGLPASVNFAAAAGTAVPGRDFKPVSGTLSFAANVRSRTFDVPILNDNLLDGDRTVLLSLSGFVLAGTPAPVALIGERSTATLTIADDDRPGAIKLSSAKYGGNEGTTVVITIVRQPVDGAPLGGNVSVDFLASGNGSAVAGVDFAVVSPASATVTFVGNETTKTVRIDLAADRVEEGNETFQFSLSNPTSGARLDKPSTAVVTINDVDRAGVVMLSASRFTVAEGAGNVSVTVRRSGGNAIASVDFVTVPGTAIDGRDLAPRGAPAEAGGGADYGFVFQTLSFGAGEMSKTVVIPIFQDDVAEGNEVFRVELRNPRGGLRLGSPSSASVTIVDDEVVIQFSGKFKNSQPEVIRTGPLTANVSVQYFAESGTAILGEDFILKPGTREDPGTLVFPPGVSSRLIPIKVVNDNIVEGPETFTVTLFNPSPPAQLGPNFSQVFTIDDNDFGGTVSFSNTSPTGRVGETVPIRIVRAGGAGTVMTVGLSVLGGTASAEGDFFLSSDRVTFLANQSAQTFLVNIANSASAAGKTIVFGLTIPGGPDGGAAKLGAANISTLTILSPASVIEFASATYDVTEDMGVATITVKRTGDLSQPATVQYATSDGTATSDGDYSQTSGTLSFPASGGSYQRMSFTVDVISDGVVEGPETVNLTLSNAVGAALGTNSTAVLTINDPPATPGYSFIVLYSGGASVSAPTINDNHQFAFSVNTGAAETVYAGNLSAPSDLRIVTALPDSGVQSLAGLRFPVDGGENVAFLATLTLGNNAIVVDSNSSAPTVLFEVGPGILSIGEPSFSLNGTLAFQTSASLCEGPCAQVRVGTATAGFGIAAKTGDSTDAGFLNGISGGTAVAVNDSGLAAFLATTFSDKVGIFTGNASQITTIATSDTFFDFGANVAINNAGEVAFIGTELGGVISVVVGNGASTVPVASTGSNFKFFGGTGVLSFFDSSPVIGNSGIVAFVAGRPNGVMGIYTGADPVANKVVETGDIVDGRMVMDVQVGGINANGQISFLATLSDGVVSEVAAIVATPPPLLCADGCILRPSLP